MDVPAALTRFIPKFETLFLNVKGASDAELLKTDHPFGWLLTVLKQETADESAFIAALDRLGAHLETLDDADREAWKQAIYYLYLLIFFQRSAAEHERLTGIVSAYQKSLGFSGEEAALMQSMAAYYLEQGIEQGKTEAYQQWQEWNTRRMEAEAKGEPFDEPPPTLTQNGELTRDMRD